MKRRDVLLGGAAGLILSGPSMAQTIQRQRHPVRRPGVYVEELPSQTHTIEAQPTDVALFIGAFSPRFPTGTHRTITSFNSLPLGFRGANIAARMFFEAGGQTLILINAAHRDDGTADFDAALASLENTDAPQFNLLLLVGAEDLYGDDPTRLAGLYQTAAEAARSRYAHLLIEAPEQATGHQGWRDALGLDDPDMAAWAPHLKGHGENDFTPGPAIAGLIAASDQNRGVWKAPAGVNAILPGYNASIALSNSQVDEMAMAHINPIREMRGVATLWGARTLSSDPEWKYLPVRRAARWIEHSLSKGLEWTAFEPNDEPLWAQIRSSVDGFMNGLFREGAFQGSNAQNAYFVHCGLGQSMTQNDLDLDLGRVVVEIGFAPIRPAEFIVLRLLLPAGSD